jgi:SnoaL-like protein
MSTAFDYVADRWAILDTVTRYFTAIDQRDFELLRTVFTDDVDAVYEGAKVAGGIDRLLAFVTGRGDVELPVDVINVQLSMHFIGNHVAVVDGDTARAESYALAHLVDRPPSGPRMRTRGLRYKDELVRSAAGWRIRRREHLCDWMRRDALEWAPGVPPSSSVL